MRSATVAAQVFPMDTRGELSCNEPMARHTSWRVGGPARRFYRPACLEDLAGFLNALPPSEPLLWLGLGSNLLVRDGGFPGTVIATHPALGRIRRVDCCTLRVESGVPSPKVARFCARLALGGVEFLAGIPGTMGGALAMNAGAFGACTWDYVTAVETIDRAGRRRMREPCEYQVGYREIRGPSQEWFVAAYLRLVPGARDEMLRRMRLQLALRNAKQPIGLPTAGSVFRNPDGDHAARLIESCGLKGDSVGPAAVSEKHANFIVNRGGARGAEVEALMEKVAATVHEWHGVRLTPEVCVVGTPTSERVSPT